MINQNKPSSAEKIDEAEPEPQSTETWIDNSRRVLHSLKMAATRRGGGGH